MEGKMKWSVNSLVFIILILATSACSPYGPYGPDGDPYVVSSDLLIINTVNPQYGIVLSHKNGEVLLLATQSASNGSISNVTSATWISPDRQSITVYLDKGLPAYAVAEENLIIFQYNDDKTVNVTIIAPDGATSSKSNISFDSTQVAKIPSGWKTLWNSAVTSQEWAEIATTAFGAFSCSGTGASGGSLAILLGQGCSSAIYLIWKTGQGMETQVVYAVNSSVFVVCTIDPKDPNPRSMLECASAWVDVGSKMSRAADQVVLHNLAIIPTVTK